MIDLAYMRRKYLSKHSITANQVQPSGYPTWQILYSIFCIFYWHSSIPVV